MKFKVVNGRVGCSSLFENAVKAVRAGVFAGWTSTVECQLTGREDADGEFDCCKQRAGQEGEAGI